MSLNDLLKAVCAEFKSHFPSLRTCEPHGGRFDLQELKRISTKAPAVFVAILGTGKVKEVGSGEVDIPVSLAAFVVTKTEGKLPCAESALNVAEGLLTRIPGSNWACDGVFGADPATAKNLYSGTIASKGVAMWAVTWTQKVRMGEDAFRTDLPFPSELYVGQSPNVGDGHEGDYMQVEVGA
ncbi:hypothetical protein DSLASN_02450 [Desulfoluna limicola]|uniref:Uncharacterized protein n=1 Tax=Desulfoluna limicola TaxID=2810562 RepID=A0ABN6EW91_9BACT|nr:hypothetical protein [Desulfoluna limicola]BCS94613.1 hypothetical protein DSLASN_02450 [Desulfoluna limicola]